MIQPSAGAAKTLRVVGAPRRVRAQAADNLELVDDALRIETEVFEACGYGHMPTSLDPQSTFFVALDDETSEVVGAIRMIDSGNERLPVLELPREGQWAARIRPDEDVRVVEYGALAVPPSAQATYGQQIAKALYRAGWRYTLSAGCDYSGMVMEPRRALAMARWHGLAFDQAGPTRYYMGGDVAAHFASPQTLLARLGEANPRLHEFMIDGLSIDELEAAAPSTASLRRQAEGEYR